MSDRTPSQRFLFSSRPQSGSCPVCGSIVVPVTLAHLVRGEPGKGISVGPFPSVHWLCPMCRAAASEREYPEADRRAVGD